jgi:hypothetical protein
MQAGQQPPGQHQHQGKPPGQQQHQGKPPGQQPASKVTTKQDTLDKIISTLRSIGCYIAAFIGLFLDLILYVVAKIAQTPAFLTSTAAIIIMGPVLLYLLSLNAETYYVGMGGSPFLMKFLIDDGSQWVNFTNGDRAKLFASFFMSLAVTAICTIAWRDNRSIASAKKEYDEHKHHKVDDGNPNEIKIVSLLRDRYKDAGMKSKRFLMCSFLFVFTLDCVSAGSQYNPIKSLPMCLWFVLSCIGTEAGIALCDEANTKWEAHKNERKMSPKTTVVR